MSMWTALGLQNIFIMSQQQVWSLTIAHTWMYTSVTTTCCSSSHIQEGIQHTDEWASKPSKYLSSVHYNFCVLIGISTSWKTRIWSHMRSIFLSLNLTQALKPSPPKKNPARESHSVYLGTTAEIALERKSKGVPWKTFWTKMWILII